MDIAGSLELLRATGKGKDDDATSPYANRLRTLLEQPNKLQSWPVFRLQQVIYKKVFGYCPMLALKPVGFGNDSAIALVNLPPWLFDIEVNPNVNFFSISDEPAIKNYKFTFRGKVATFPIEDVLILADTAFMNEDKHFLLPTSRLVGQDMAISNICAAMEADNVLLKKKGPLGFISHDAGAVKDSVVGYLPMTEDEKMELQRSLNMYGLSLDAFQYAISRQAVKWNPMSFDVKGLGTKETLIAGAQALCHGYNYPYVLFEQSGTTYANGAQASKAVYQDNVIPSNMKDMKQYEKFFKAQENAVKILTWYDDLPVMQENKKEAAEAALAQDNALEKEYKNNLITKNQWLTARGYNTIADGDVYYKDEEDKEEPKEVDQPIEETDEE
jgi:hypothetical protein